VRLNCGPGTHSGASRRLGWAANMLLERKTPDVAIERTCNDCTPLAMYMGSKFATLLPLEEPPQSRSNVMVILGDAGMGKTFLFEETAERARSFGTTVLSTTGRDSESTLAFASLYELLRPVLARLSGLSPQLEKALCSAFVMGRRPDETERHLIGIAVLALISDVSRHSPLLLIVDDAHWIDSSSLDVINFVGHRLVTDAVALLIGGRENQLPIGFDRTFPEVLLDPLSVAAANELLNEQASPPRGRARTRVLAQSAGNPMALIELTRVMATDNGPSRSWATEPLPLKGRLTAGIATRFASLPEVTQAALLYAAIADGSDLSSAIAGGNFGGVADALAPAEELGLVHIGHAGLQFSNPFVRSAIYYVAPFVRRAAAHRRMAEMLRDIPHRHAWHLAAATLSPDEPLAAMLEATAVMAEDREGVQASVETMERAAELSTDPAQRARRLVAAAALAVSTGQVDWVQDLATRALDVTSDPELRMSAHRALGWASLWGSRRTLAIELLDSVVKGGLDHHLYESWEALGSATTAAYYLGTPAASLSLRGMLDLLEHKEQLRLSHDQQDNANIFRSWAKATISPHLHRNNLVPYIAANAPRLEAERPLHFQLIGSIAYILDESDLAVELLRDSLDHPRTPRLRGATGTELTMLAFALRDVGRLDDGLAVAAEASDLALDYGMDIVAALAATTSGFIEALRGNVERSRRDVNKALASVEADESRSVMAVARHALGLAALAEGSYLMAFTQLRQLFATDGTPLHNHLSYLGVADMAEAAVRAGRRLEGGELLERVIEGIPGTPSPRVELLIALANAVVADPVGAEAHFDKALSYAHKSKWPFELARLYLAYGEWLRRRRRINESKPMLMDALVTFRQLGAEPWTHHCEAELRACGVKVGTSSNGLSDLTAQQQQIVRCASEGLTNREIGAKLFLSPRTIASHLYRSYPKLGITARHQLRDVVAQTDQPDEDDN
jgi:DNA-binding CsgD family transcriptional regulator